MRYLALGAFLWLAGCRTAPETTRTAGEASAYTLNTGDCRACHQQIVDQYLATAHARTSGPADSVSIGGSFAQEHNVLKTRNPKLSFRMERRRDGFYQTAVDLIAMSQRSERFDIVVGSARKGQSYLYWRNRVLFQLPVSYLVGTHSWINSPGYPDGAVDFDRVIPPRCLECHATSFSIEGPPGQEYYAERYLLTITCEKCHGDARGHLARVAAVPPATGALLVVNPARLSRARQLDNCGLCHSGPAKWLQPPFSYRPGDSLGAFLAADTSGQNAVPDVHGNQVGLLRLSACFRASPTMTCSTCHNVHRTERDLATLGQKCLACHQQHPAQHKPVGLATDALTARCVSCHMPDNPSKGIQINTPTTQFAPSYRSHRIAVYPEMTAAVRAGRTEQ